MKRTKNDIKKLISIYLLIFVSTSSLCGCSHTANQQSPLVSKYSGSGANEQYPTSCLVDINTNETNEQLKSENLLVLKDLDNPLLAEFGISYFNKDIEGSKIILNVYYDFNI